jgi:hypothetical protein
VALNVKNNAADVLKIHGKPSTMWQKVKLTNEKTMGSQHNT